jgi:hypothetical protein
MGKNLSEMTLREIELAFAMQRAEKASRVVPDASALMQRVPSPATIRRRLRARLVHRLRQDGRTWAEIATELGVSSSRARAIASDGDLDAGAESRETDERKLSYLQRWFCEEGLAEAERHHRQSRL